MSIRIYALAKELEFENKFIMDLCNKIGIPTKGSSALASISDEDAVRVKEYLKKGDSASAKNSQDSEIRTPMEPPKNIVMGRVPTLPSKPRRTEKKEPVKVENEQDTEVGTALPEKSVSAKSSDVLVNAPEETSVHSETISENPASDAGKINSSNRPTDVSAEKCLKMEVSAISSENAESNETEISLASLATGHGSNQENEPSETAFMENKSVSEKAIVESERVSEKEAENKALAESLSPSETAQENEAPGAELTPNFTVSKEETTKEVAATAQSATEAERKSFSDGRQGREQNRKKDGNRENNRDNNRGDRRRGNGPLSRKMKRETAPEEPVRPSGLSVAEKIAREAQLNAPVRPAFDTSFPTLHTARTIRHEDKDAPKTSSHRDERRSSGLRLAPLPTAKTPIPKKTAESNSMKPEVRLTPEEIRAARAGDDSIMRRMEQEMEKNRAKENNRDRDARGKNKDRARNEKGSSATSSSDRNNDRKTRRNATPDKTVRPQQPITVMEDNSSKFGSKKTAGKQRKDNGKRTNGGDLESLHAPGRDSRFGAVEKRGKSRRFSIDDDDDDSPRYRTRKQRASGSANVAAPRKSSYVLQLPLTVRTFAEGVGLTAAKVLGKLMMEFGMPSTITSPLDETTAQLLAESFGIPVDIRPEITLEERLIGNTEREEDNPDDLTPRPPVVTFLGHVDHGKTSLLDKIININVVSGEKGGITQHIRAYNVKYQDKSVTFVDTPGHEAFTEMRARGANTTDIAVIVVAADDGVMPQTEEAISHARAAGVPIIVALNKIDLPGVNEMRILQELAANELTPSEWGGDVEVVRCSALTGEGIDELMETLLMVAELQEFKANPKRSAIGVCVESSIQQGRGVVAKLLVQNGTLHTGDVLVCGSSYGRVKAMTDTLDVRQKYAEAGPAIPVNVLGLDTAPGAGDKFYVLDEIADARRLAEERAEQERLNELAGTAKAHVTLEGLFDSLGSKEVKTLNIILRTDVRGSIEAIKKELGKLEHEEVQISILQASVGGVTEADVQLANASDAIIIGFNVVPDENARIMAENKGVQIRRYDIIYQLTADVKAALEGMLTPEEHEKDLGRAVVQQIFQISRVGTVAGCRVISGVIQRDCKIRIIRNNRIIGIYPLDTLKRGKDDAKEVRDGYECGMRLAGFNDVKEGDVLEAFMIESVARTF